MPIEIPLNRCGVFAFVERTLTCARRLGAGLCILALAGGTVADEGFVRRTESPLAYGMRVGSLLPQSSLDGRPGLRAEAFARYRLTGRLALEAGAGYGRFVTRDRVRGPHENFATDMGLVGLKALWRPFKSGGGRQGIVPHVFGGGGLLRYDIDRLTPRRGGVKPIGWTGRVPLGVGGAYRLGAVVAVIEAGYSFTFSGALDEVDDGGNDGFWGVTLGVAFSAGSASPLVHRSVETPRLSSLDTADRDGDGLDEREETRVHFTNPLMADSDGDGLSDGREATEVGSDPNRADSDGGGMDDGAEVEAGLDPLDAGDDRSRVDVAALADEKAAVPAAPPALPATPGFETVFFGMGGVGLDAAAEEKVRRLAARLKRWPALQVELRGYADSVGDAVANRRLSLRRAHAVRDALVRAGIALDRMRTAGLGEADPIASNGTSGGRSRNRRVEVVPLPAVSDGGDSGGVDAVDPGP